MRVVNDFESPAWKLWWREGDVVSMTKTVFGWCYQDKKSYAEENTFKQLTMTLHRYTIQLKYCLSPFYCYWNHLPSSQRRIEKPRYSFGLMIGIWASLGLDFAIFPIFYPILGLFMGEFCHFVTFCPSRSGVDKMIQYVPATNQGKKLVWLNLSTWAYYLYLQALCQLMQNDYNFKPV